MNADNQTADGGTQSQKNLSVLLAAAQEAAEAAGSFQLSEFRSRGPGWGDPKDAKEFVSFVDVQSEGIIRERLQKEPLLKLLPGVGFYGEETEQRRGSTATWVVDPLDGTTNYLSGFDYFSVSIALWDEAGPALGVVYRPSTGELFTAIRGQGATLNGQTLPRSGFLEAKDALIGTGTPYRSPDTVDSFFAATRGVLRACRDIRRTGSCAIDLCYLAAGYFQGFWEVDLQPYDVAAGLLMLAETGHRVAEFSGNTYDPFVSRSLVAGRSGVFEVLQQIALESYGAMR